MTIYCAEFSTFNFHPSRKLKFKYIIVYHRKSLVFLLLMYPMGCLTYLIRYDVRLLLDTLPEREATSSSSSNLLAGEFGQDDNDNSASDSDSLGGWSDLPSDTEDTFFLSPEEVEDYQRNKRRKRLEDSRNERLRALGEDDDEHIRVNSTHREEDAWGGSDEEVRIFTSFSFAPH